jgi:hypothetical protein
VFEVSKKAWYLFLPFLLFASSSLVRTCARKIDSEKLARKVRSKVDVYKVVQGCTRRTHVGLRVGYVQYVACARTVALVLPPSVQRCTTVVRVLVTKNANNIDTMYRCTQLHIHYTYNVVVCTSGSTKLYARAPAHDRLALLLRARCTSARETLHDDSTKTCAHRLVVGSRISRASRRKRRS